MPPTPSPNTNQQKSIQSCINLKIPKPKTPSPTMKFPPAAPIFIGNPNCSTTTSLHLRGGDEIGLRTPKSPIGLDGVKYLIKSPKMKLLLRLFCYSESLQRCIDGVFFFFQSYQKKYNFFLDGNLECLHQFCCWPFYY